MAQELANARRIEIVSVLKRLRMVESMDGTISLFGDFLDTDERQALQAAIKALETVTWEAHQ